MNRILFIGTYSQRGSRGVYAASADSETGALRLLDRPAFPAGLRNATWVAAHAEWLYAAADAEGDPRPGVVAAFRISGDGGALIPAGTLPCGVGSPCHVLVFDQGRRLAVSQYKTGELYIIRLSPDGSLQSVESVFRTAGQGPVADRQEGPHIHSAASSPDGAELFAADLGLDCVFRYAVQPGKLQPLAPILCPAGSGPRHMAVSADGDFLWVAGELDSTVIGFRREGNAFRRIGHWPLLPAGYVGTSYAAEIRLHPNGRWLYATNRGLDDVVAMAVEADGSIDVIGRVSTGRWPRGMILSPDGRFLYAASQHEDRIDWYAIHPATGVPEKRGDMAGIPAPVGFAFVP